MANLKISQLTEDTAPTFDDLTVTVNDPAGTPATRKAKLINTTGAPINAQTGTSYTVLTTDYRKLVTHTNGSAIAVTLPQAGASFPANWFYLTQNRGAGAVTITPTTSTIDGAATLVLNQNEGALIVSDGTNYFTMRGKQASGGGAGGSITSSGYTMSTSRLLGRTTASSGAIEEISVGSGLSLSGGSLTATGGATFAGGDFDKYRIIGVNARPNVSTTQDCFGHSAIVPFAGSAASEDDADGPWRKLNTSASTDTTAGYSFNNGGLAQTRWLPQLTCKIKTGSSITVQRIWIGFFTDDPTTADPTTHGLGFRYNTASSDTTWKTFSNDNSGGGTINDSGVTVSADTCYVFAIKVVSTSSVEFYISTNNGDSFSLVQTHTTNLPTSSAGMDQWINLRTLENVSKTFKHSFTYIRMR